MNDPRFINPSDSGYGMNAQWMDEFHHALQVCAGQEKTGYYADFDGVTHLAKSYRNAYVYDAYADQQTLVLHRWQADQAVVCVLNFSKELQFIPTPVTGKQWQKRLDSTDPQ